MWDLLLDPNTRGACVPGMQSIDVVSDVEYVAHMAVKIAFIQARFRLVTRIVETRAPHYLRVEGTGEDASVASSLRQSSEIFLTPLHDGGTQLRIRVQADVLGRLGTFGLGVMKTKADRMWDEFGSNLLARLTPGEAVAPATSPGAAATTPPSAVSGGLVHAGNGSAIPKVAANGHAGTPALTRHAGGLLSRLLGRASSSADICVEVRRRDETIVVRWPAHHGEQCAAWLRDYLK